MNPQESKKLEKKVAEILKAHINPSDTVILGVSGGPDSVFLLKMLAKIPCKLIVAHINHRLRKEADSDESFVRNLAITPLVPSQICNDNCRTNSPNQPTPSLLHFKSLTANISKLSQKSHKGLEETGRQVRYDFFKKLSKKYHAKYILTAHQADDNLETIIGNFTRGAGLQGLCGMQTTETIQNTTTTLFRPLLAFSKKQILTYLKLNKIPYRTDKTNKDTVYKRNFIRHKIIPLLTELNPNLIQTIAQNSENLREIDELLKKQAQTWLTKNAEQQNKKLSTKTRTIIVSATPLRTQPPALQKAILLELHKTIIGSTTNLTTKNLEEILTLLNKNIGNKTKKLGKLTFTLNKNTLEIT